MSGGGLARTFATLLIAGMLALPLAAFRGIQRQLPHEPLDPSLLATRIPALPKMEQVLALEFPVLHTYQAQKGDDFWRLCKQLQLGPDLRNAVRSSSDLQLLIVKPGTPLVIPNQKGTLYTVDSPENLAAIAGGFSRGRIKGNRFDQEILEANGYPLPNLADPEFKFNTGTALFLPGVLKPMGLPSPLMGRVSSGFGIRRHPVLGITRAHKGMDIPKPYGTPVTASRKGVVTFAGWEGGYGQMVELRHTLRIQGQVKTFYTRYGHLSKIYVHEGQTVSGGRLIGRVGSTGISTGPHLHFEVRDGGGTAHNPAGY